MKYILYLMILGALVGIFSNTFAERDDLIVREAIKRADERHAHIYYVLAKCMNEKTTIRVGEEPVADCLPIKPRKK